MRGSTCEAEKDHRDGAPGEDSTAPCSIALPRERGDRCGHEAGHPPNDTGWSGCAPPALQTAAAAPQAEDGESKACPGILWLLPQRHLQAPASIRGRD